MSSGDSERPCQKKNKQGEEQLRTSGFRLHVHTTVPAHLHRKTCIHMHHTCAHIYKCILPQENMYTQTPYTWCTHLYMDTSTGKHAYTYTHVHISTVPVHLHRKTCINIHHTCAHIYTWTPAQENMHTHTPYRCPHTHRKSDVV